MIFLAGIFLLIPSLSWAMPSWFKDGTRLSGATYIVTCSGDGPAVDLARRYAINGCQASASSQLQHTIAVKSVSVETESDVGFHQEVTEVGNFKNLTCIPEQEEVEDLNSGFRVWLQCRFDLAKGTQVSEIPNIGSQKTISQTDSPQQAIAKSTPTVVRSSERRVLSLTTVPQCDSVLVEGGRSRIQHCDRNPMAIVLTSEDQTIVIRAHSYQPKTLPINKEGKDYESSTVVLDHN